VISITLNDIICNISPACYSALNVSALSVDTLKQCLVATVTLKMKRFIPWKVRTDTISPLALLARAAAKL